MKISRLRRALAVFLSVMMLTLCAPLTAFAAEVTITLDPNYGTEAATSETTDENGCLTEAQLAAPTRTGYTFGGWYTDPVKGEKVDDTTSFNGNTTVYAQWLDDDLQGTTTYLESVQLTADVGDATGTKYVFSGIPELSQAEIDAGFKYICITMTMDCSYDELLIITEQLNQRVKNNPLSRTESTTDTLQINDIPEDKTITISSLCIAAIAKINENVYIEADPRSYNCFAVKYFAAGKAASSNEHTITFDLTNGGALPDGTANTATTTDGKLATLPTPTFDGYTFGGWYTDPVKGEKVDNTTSFDGDTTVYAQWVDDDLQSAVTYLESAQLNAAVGDTTGTKYVFSDIPELSQAEIDAGFKYICITMTMDCSYDELLIITEQFNQVIKNNSASRTECTTDTHQIYDIPEDKTITVDSLCIASIAKINENVYIEADPRSYNCFAVKYFAAGKAASSNEYTITFDLTNGGALPEGTANTATTTDGKLATLPAPTRTGYLFRGWYTAETDGTRVTVDTEFNSNTTIYAQWYDLNRPVEYIATATLEPASENTETEYIFRNIPELTEAEKAEGFKYGYYIRDVSSIGKEAAENQVTNINDRLDTFYLFETAYEKEYRQVVPADNTITVDKLSIVILFKYSENYTYVFDDVDSYYCFGAKYFVAGPAPVSTEYTITFDPNGGALPEDTASTATTENGKLTSLPTPNRYGFTFGGWYTDAAKGIKVTADTAFTENSTIYAQWLDDDLQSAITYLESAKLTAAVGDTTGTKYVFSDIPELSQAEIDAGFKYVYTVDTGNDSYEGLKRVADEINNMLNSKLFPRMGSNTKSSEIKDIPEDNTITVEYLSHVVLAKINVNVHKEGDAESYYCFAGKYFPAGKVAAPIEYTITLKYQDDKTADTTSTTENGKLTSLPTPTRDGYTFKGWFDAATDGNEVTTATTFTENTTIYAQWTENAPTEYTITLKYQDDKTADTTATTENGKLTSLPTPTRDGYTFKGWFDAATDGNEVTTATVFEADATIYAQWEKNVVYPALPKVTATAGENSVSLKWTAVDGAASYRVFYRVNGTKIWTTKNTTATSVTISDLTGGTKYDFLVLAYDGTNWSKYTSSDIINATPKTAAPAAPAKPAFTVTAGEESVTVKWTAVSGATSYRVFYRVNGTEKWATKNTTGTSVAISDLTGGKKYDFLVRAYNGAAWSTYTNADIKTATPKAVVAAPAAPSISSVTPYENSAVIRWTASNGATSYRVFYRINGTAKWSYKNTTQTAMTLWDLTGGKKYDILVCAYNGKAWSAYTAQDIKNVVPVKATPKPTITSATPGKNSVTVKWTAVSGAKSYRVFYRVKGTSKWLNVNTTRTQATISGLTGGKTYEILVRSYSASGWSSYSPKDYAEAEINS